MAHLRRGFVMKRGVDLSLSIHVECDVLDINSRVPTSTIYLHEIPL